MKQICGLLLACLSLASAMVYPHRLSFRTASDIAQNAVKVDKRYGPFLFDQAVDHFSSSNVTFKQRYWANTDWYEAGGPVILYNAGELAADERSVYVTNSTMAQLAEALHGIVIVMEHRLYGESQPGKDFSIKNLKTLTTDQALEDMASIIRDIKLPNLDVDLPPAPKTKWIVYGGSYSGNLAAWMRQRYPHLVFAAIPSSAPVQMRYDFPQYFEAVQKYAPRHCIHAVKSVISYVDHILFHPLGDKKGLKKKFGVEDIEYDDDFADLLTYPLGLWQNMKPGQDPFGDEFCAIFDEAKSLHEYIHAYGKYIASVVNEVCGDKSSQECLGTHDPESPVYSDLTSENRAWLWQVCTEYAYWQTSPPVWRRLSSITSRKLTTTWYQRQCRLMFGDAIPSRPAWRETNRALGGWHIRLSRVFWIDGEWDPWRTLSVQSDEAPDRTGWDDDAYFAVLPKAVHHWDFFVSDQVDSSIKAVQQKVLEALQRWISEADAKKGTLRFVVQTNDSQ